MRRAHENCRLFGRVAAVCVLLALVFAGGVNAAEAVKGELNVATDGGFARLSFRLDDEVETSVQVSGAILVISFKKPVDVAVDRINARAPDFVSAARRDPD